MKRRVMMLIAAGALLIAGAVPAVAAPGGVPGPPPGHAKAADDAVADDADVEMSKLPEHAKAYGKRIKDAFGLTYGHLRQCGEDSERYEDCPEGLEFPEDEFGAAAFWAFADAKALFVSLLDATKVEA